MYPIILRQLLQCVWFSSTKVVFSVKNTKVPSKQETLCQAVTHTWTLVYNIHTLCLYFCHCRYELVHGYSSNPMGGNPPLAGHRTDTTDETSLDASSDGRSRSLRRDEYYGSMIYPTILPPPPLLDSTSEQYQPQHSYRYQQHERGFHTLQTRHPIHAVDNNIYATINRYKKPTHTSVLDTLPPPPSPPPPPPHQTARAQLSDDDVASRGLSQCSVAGCSQSNSGGQGTITSRKSNSSNKRRSSRRQSPTPSRSSRKSSHRRKSSKGQSLELISTNL